MAKFKQAWPAQDFDAISIRAARCQVEVQASDDDQVGLEGDFDGRDFVAGPDIEGRWLKLHRVTRGGDQNILLTLPAGKVWAVNIFAGHGDIKVRGIRARLNIMIGHGDVSVEEYRGMLAVSAGNGNVRLKDFSQEEMPREPAAQPPQMPRRPAPPPKPGHEASDRFPWNWRYWEGNDWEEWGLDLSEKITGWVLNMGRFFERTTVNPREAGISAAVGQGDIHYEEIISRTCLARVGKGDIRLKNGRIGNLEVITSRGDLECASILPEGDWSLRAVHGDVHLSLPANASARLDAATRHGDICSEIPVVRVARQGPETYRGQRMVGTIGAKAEGEVPELRISVMNGDIDIKSQSSVHAPSVSTVNASAGPRYRTQLEVLQALSRGQINVDKAERLLSTLGSCEEKDK
jgi:DUF4097 and DUF4098 domain-containing protein YvlB